MNVFVSSFGNVFLVVYVTGELSGSVNDGFPCCRKDLFVSSTDNFSIITWELMKKMKNKAVVHGCCCSPSVVLARVIISNVTHLRLGSVHERFAGDLLLPANNVSDRVTNPKFVKAATPSTMHDARI